jgi:glc operon protein GlcG
MKTTQTLDYSEAKQIIDRIVKQALRMKKAAVIAVAYSHGELIAFARMDGAPISSIRIAANKAWTAARERKSTKDIGEKARHPEKGHDIAYLTPSLWDGAAAFQCGETVRSWALWP